MVRPIKPNGRFKTCQTGMDVESTENKITRENQEEVTIALMKRSLDWNTAIRNKKQLGSQSSSEIS